MLRIDGHTQAAAQVWELEPLVKASSCTQFIVVAVLLLVVVVSADPGCATKRCFGRGTHSST